MSLFMVEFSFETTLETRGIRNFQASFQARNAVKSLFKAVLEGLQTRDELALFRQDLQVLQELNAFTGASNASILTPSSPSPLPPGLLEDFENITFYTPYIRPIDHLFNLNRIQPRNITEPDSVPDTEARAQFFQIVAGFPIIDETVAQSEGVAPEPYFLDELTILQLYGSLFDWMDVKDNDAPYTSAIAGTLGAEQVNYLDYGGERIVKNRGLDQLTELRLIQGVRASGIQWESWERYFTVYPVGDRSAAPLEGEARINVNLATEAEIVEFLQRHDQQAVLNGSTSMQEYVVNAANIAAVLKREPEPTGPLGLVVPVEYRRAGEILDALDADPTTQGLPRNVDQFFITFSRWYQIRLIAEVDNVRAELSAVVQVRRDSEGQALANGLTIHHFALK
jgi:hypothetical protein